MQQTQQATQIQTHYRSASCRWLAVASRTSSRATWQGGWKVWRHARVHTAWSSRSQSPHMMRMTCSSLSLAMSSKNGLPPPPDCRKLKLKSLPVPIALRSQPQQSEITVGKVK